MGVGREEGSSFFSSFVRSFESLALFPNQASTDLVSVGLSFPRSSNQARSENLRPFSAGPVLLRERYSAEERTNSFMDGRKEACVGNQKTRLI